MKQIILLAVLLPFLQFSLAQSIGLSVEISLSDLVSGGLGTTFFGDTKRHWSFGVGLGNGPIDGIAKELVFEGTDLDSLDIDLPFIVGLNARYFFQPEHKGLYAQLALGNEIFRIRLDDEVQSNPNQFAVISFGYLWKFKQAALAGWYLNPRIGANFVWNGGGKYRIGNTSYELRPVFPNPNLVLGYKF